MAKLVDYTLVEVRPNGEYLIDIEVSAGVATQLGWGAKRIDRQVFRLEGSTQAELESDLRRQLKAYRDETIARRQAAPAVPAEVGALVGVKTALDE